MHKSQCPECGESLWREQVQDDLGRSYLDWCGPHGEELSDDGGKQYCPSCGAELPDEVSTGTAV